VLRRRFEEREGVDDGGCHAFGGSDGGEFGELQALQSFADDRIEEAVGTRAGGCVGGETVKRNDGTWEKTTPSRASSCCRWRTRVAVERRRGGSWRRSGEPL